MANLLPTPNPNPAPAPQPKFTDKQVRKLAELAARGWTIGRIARHISDGSPKKMKKARRLMREIRRDPRFEEFILQEAHHDAVAALPRAVAGAARAASRGRMDAVKWIGEATGFHNPRVDHNHSGDIQITMNIPRPVRDEEAPVEIEEAEVVEE